MPRADMFETIDEPVEVLTAFLGGGMRPLRFRWKGRVVAIRRVNGRWTKREGQVLQHWFSVEGQAGDSYELCYEPRGPRWILSRAWIERG